MRVPRGCWLDGRGAVAVVVGGLLIAILPGAFGYQLVNWYLTNYVQRMFADAWREQDCSPLPVDIPRATSSQVSTWLWRLPSPIILALSWGRLWDAEEELEHRLAFLSAHPSLAPHPAAAQGGPADQRSQAARVCARVPGHTAAHTCRCASRGPGEYRYPLLSRRHDPRALGPPRPAACRWCCDAPPCWARGQWCRDAGVALFPCVPYHVAVLRWVVVAPGNRFASNAGWPSSRPM